MPSMTPSGARAFTTTPRPRLLGRLVVRRVDAELGHLDDAAQHGPGRDGHGVAGLGARVLLFVFERARHLIGDVLHQAPAQDDVQKLLAAADAQHRHVARERSAERRGLEGGAALLGLDAGVAARRPEQGGIDVEVAAGDQQSLDQAQRPVHRAHLVRQEERHAARGHHRIGVVSAAARTRAHAPRRPRYRR